MAVLSQTLVFHLEFFVQSVWLPLLWDVHTFTRCHFFSFFFIDLRSPTEKKMLQSMLRKASAIGKTLEVSKSPNNKKNASISTEDLGE